MKKNLLINLTFLLTSTMAISAEISNDMKNMLSACMSAPSPAMFNTFEALSQCVSLALTSKSFDDHAISACCEMNAGKYLKYRTSCFRAIANKTFSSIESRHKLRACVVLSNEVGFGAKALDCFSNAGQVDLQID